MSGKKLFLIDAHALCYRSFYAIRELSNSKGQPTNAVYGFVNTLRKILREFEPTHVAVCFDSKGKTFREQKFAEYKIQRQPMPEGLISQIPIIKDVVGAFHLSILEMSGHEADDLIAALATRFAGNDIEVVIVSEDKDLFQLANDHVKFFSVRQDALLDQKKLAENLGFAPKHIVDFIGLAGDNVDNIPGVDGIGEVTARKLITEFGSLENILARLDDVKPPKLQEKLRAQQKQARLSKQLALLETKSIENLELSRFKVEPPDRQKLFEMFRELEFKKFAEEYAQGQLLGASGSGVATVEAKTIKKLKGELDGVKQIAIWFQQTEEQELGDDAFLSVNGTDVYHAPAKEWDVFKSALEDETIEKVTFDLKGSLKVLARHGIAMKGKCFDVLLADYLLNPARARRDLNDLAWEYLKQSVSIQDAQQHGAIILWNLASGLRAQLKEKDLEKLFETIEIPLSFVLFEMETTGVTIDLDLLQELSKSCNHQISRLSEQMYKFAGEEFNLNSPKQLAQVLFEKLKLPVIKKTKTGFSTDEGVLTALAPKHEFPALLLEYRQLAKLKSTYIDALPLLVNPETGKIHATFNQAGAETGRLSSNNPNLQNIPIRTELGKQIRKAFISSEKGRLLLAADYSQMELRILAHLSKDPVLKKAFEEGQDIHTFTASLIFDVKQEDVTPEMRSSMKSVNFGIIYGMSAFGLAKDLGISQEEAQDFIDRYFARYPKVKNFMDESIKQCEKNGYVVTLANRRRYIPDIKNPNQAIRQFAQRQAINTPVQGSAADLMKLAMINIQDELHKQKFKSQMTITVHDELVFDMVKNEQEKLAALVREQMEHAIELDVPIKVTVKVGANWLEMKEIKG